MTSPYIGDKADMERAADQLIETAVNKMAIAVDQILIEHGFNPDRVAARMRYTAIRAAYEAGRRDATKTAVIIFLVIAPILIVFGIILP